ncbi:hypothetical protein GEV33_002974 [Tenebrio molitor]|uniref:Glucose dehydrogenase n=1 Tax=Tenebrio molitor TaxID=7067 RepID=A0A8J6LI82_TENMO|nr:hypothetical protein GEV33_002974 [Tenebrio molitor]
MKNVRLSLRIWLTPMSSPHPAYEFCSGGFAAAIIAPPPASSGANPEIFPSAHLSLCQVASSPYDFITKKAPTNPNITHEIINASAFRLLSQTLAPPNRKKINRGVEICNSLFIWPDRSSHLRDATGIGHDRPSVFAGTILQEPSGSICTTDWSTLLKQSCNNLATLFRPRRRSDSNIMNSQVYNAILLFALVQHIHGVRFDFLDWIEPAEDPLSVHYDFVVVGSGSAGSVIANRLSEVPHWNILVLEVGNEENFLAEVPLATSFLHFTDYTNRYLMAYQPGIAQACDNHRMPWPRGRALGGGPRKATPPGPTPTSSRTSSNQKTRV